MVAADHDAGDDTCTDGEWRHVLPSWLWRWRQLRCDRGVRPGTPV